MDETLVPVNAFIALCQEGTRLWPNPLSGAGYRLEGLEVPAPVGEAGRRVVIDCVAFNPASSAFLLGEAKSGRNVDDDQAMRYGEVSPEPLVRLLGVTVQRRQPMTQQTLFVCMEDHLNTILRGLGEAGLEVPVLAVGERAVTKDGHPFADAALETAFELPLPVPGPPPALVKLTADSPPEAFDEAVAPALVAELSHEARNVSIPNLAERAEPLLHLFGAGTRSRIIRGVGDAARRASDADPDRFEFRPPTATRDYPTVILRNSPEMADPRGRTQQYQALMGRLVGGRRRQPRRAAEGQGTLWKGAEDDLVDELNEADREEGGDV